MVPYCDVSDLWMHGDLRHGDLGRRPTNTSPTPHPTPPPESSWPTTAATTATPPFTSPATAAASSCGR
jgi:hypothetical protein